MGPSCCAWHFLLLLLLLLLQPPPGSRTHSSRCTSGCGCAADATTLRPAQEQHKQR